MSGATLARRAVILTCAIALVVGLITAVAPPQKADAAIPAGFTSTPVFTGLTLPTGIAFSPDGKVYVAEKSGIIKVFPNASSNNGVVFKDLSTRVFDFWDRGLLGITVDPRLGNGTGHDFVYVLYAKDAPPGQTPPVWHDDCPTPPGGLTDGCVVASTLSRIPVNANGTSGNEQILIDDEWCQQFTTHSAGHLAWGFDGSLYVTGGDGASYENADWGQFGGSLAGSPTPKNPCGDPPGGKGVANTSPTGRGGAMRAQSVRRPAGEPRVLSGALLRVNPDTGAGVPGNPMYDAAAPSANASRILAYGFRNPFRFTTRPGTNEIWVADVGWGIYEEIDRVMTPTPTVAPDYGWPCLEWETHLSGYRDLDMCKALYNDTANPPVNPYFAYEHGQSVPGGNDTCGAGEDGSSITGAAFYSGNKYPTNYSKALFFADNARNCIWTMSAGANGLPDTSTAKTFIDNDQDPHPVDLEADPVSGDIFYVNIQGGTVNRISYVSSNGAPTAVASATPTSGTAPLSVQLNGSASTDPDGDNLTYSWDTDGNGTFGDATGKTPTVTYANGGTYPARLLVTDPGGLTSTSSTVTITVTSPNGPANTAPPTITGTAQVGSTLTSTTGTWGGAQPITYARQWQRCTAGAGTSYKDAVLANAPVAYWRLGDTSGTAAADASGNARPGTYKNGVVLNRASALKSDKNPAIQMDGNDDYVLRNPIAGFPTTEIATELWVKATDTTKEAGIVSYAASTGADEFQLRDYRALKVFVKGTRTDTGIALNDGKWHHLAVIWASGTGKIRVYKDGVLGFTNTVPVQAGAKLTGNGALVLGQDQDSVGGGFDPGQAYLGWMDDFALYKSALSADKIKAHYDAAEGTFGTTCADIANATATTYSPQLADQGATIRVRVAATNAGGTSSATSAAVGPIVAGSNTPPVPTISAPATTLTWKAGDTVSFAGSASDAQDGTEPASRLSWSIILGHCTDTGCHTHPVATRDGVASGTIAAPDHQAPSYLELTLTATDASGATTSLTRRIEPKTVDLTFKTSPPGLALAVGAAQSAPAPQTQKWVVNSQVQMTAPAQQTLNGVTYTFTGWSDAGAATHTVNAPATATSYTATYSGGGQCTGTTYASAVTADAPTVYWRLGEVSGTTAADTSGNARPGTYVGGVGLNQPGALAGDGNTAASFDGNDDNVIRNPIAGVGTTGISTDLWLKTADTTKEAGIVSYAASTGADEFQLRDARALKVYIKGTRLDTGVVLNDGIWHHVAVTWTSTGGLVNVYKDGTLAYTNPIPVQDGASITGGGALVLGQEQDAVGGGFDPTQAYLGQLDDVALYPTVLTPARVTAHRQAGITSGCSGVAATSTGASARTAATPVARQASVFATPRKQAGAELLPDLVPGTEDRIARASVVRSTGLATGIRPGFCPLGEV